MQFMWLYHFLLVYSLTRRNAKQVTNSEVEIKLSMMLSDGVDLTLISFARLQFISGLRISDLLAIRRNDIGENLNVYVRQSKGSQAKVISLLYDKEFWSNYKRGLYTDISVFNSMTFYRLYRRYNLVLINGPGRNSSVTHSARKLLARTSYDATNSVDMAQAALGHKSQNSTLYYLSDEQRRAELKKGISGTLTGATGNLKFRRMKGYTIMSLIK